MQLHEVVAALEAIAPTRYAETWDNVGLLVGDPAAPASRVLLAIDYTTAVAEEVRAGGYDTVVAYHPVIFDGLKRVTVGGPVFDAVRRGVAIYSPHTALDVAPGGTNDVLADALGLTERAPLRPARAPGPDALPAGAGMGRAGTMPPAPRGEVFDRIKKALGLGHLLVAGPTEGTVTRAAAGAGACGDLIKDALAFKAEVYLTGELRHHDALRAAAAGMTVVCTLHSNSERATLARLKAQIAERLPSLTVHLSRADRDPFLVQ